MIYRSDWVTSEFFCQEYNHDELFNFSLISNVPVYQLLAGTHLDQVVPAASVGSHCPIPEAGKAQVDHWWKKTNKPQLSTAFTSVSIFFLSHRTEHTTEINRRHRNTALTVVLEVPGCMVQGCTDPWEHRGGLVVQGDHVGLDLHVDQGDRGGHPLEWLVPENTQKSSVNKLTEDGRLCRRLTLKRSVSHPDFLLHQLPGVVDLLRRASDCEHFDVGICVGWRIPLQLDPGSRLLADALDCLTTWERTNVSLMNLPAFLLRSPQEMHGR